MVRFLHFVDNENSPGGRLSKIMPLVAQFNNKMATIYTSDTKLSIDEIDDALEGLSHIQVINKE